MEGSFLAKTFSFLKQIMDNIINMFQNHISGLSGSPPIFENKIDTNNIIAQYKKSFFFNICLKEKSFFLINKK